MSVGSTPDPRINDPAIQARARADYQKRLATDPSLKGIPEGQAINEIAAKYVADTAARDPNFATSFSAEALKKDGLEDLGNVTAAEEHDATTIMRSGEVIAKELPSPRSDEAMLKAQQADTKALTEAQEALASLKKQGLPDDVVRQYEVQVADLTNRMKAKYNQAPTQEEKDNALIRQAYNDVFHREPDVGGAAYHLDRVQKMRAAGKSDVEIAAQLHRDFEGGEEYKLMHANDPKPADPAPQWKQQPASGGLEIKQGPPPMKGLQDQLQQATAKIAGSAVPENDHDAMNARAKDEQTLDAAHKAMEAFVSGGGDKVLAQKQFDAVQQAYDHKWGAKPKAPSSTSSPAIQHLDDAAKRIAGTSVPENDQAARKLEEQDRRTLAEAGKVLAQVLDDPGMPKAAREAAQRHYNAVQAAYQHKWGSVSHASPPPPPPSAGHGNKAY